jgi:hypothetical protein
MPPLAVKKSSNDGDANNSGYRKGPGHQAARLPRTCDKLAMHVSHAFQCAMADDFVRQFFEDFSGLFIFL